MIHDEGGFMKVLHVLANSRPDMNGYAHRTHEILTAQQSNGGAEVFALTSPWYPERMTLDEDTTIDGITYRRCLHPALQEKSGSLGKRWVARRGLKKRERYNSSKHELKIEDQSSSTDKTTVPQKISLGVRRYMIRPVIRMQRKGRRLLKKTTRPMTEPMLLWHEERVVMKHFTQKIIEVAIECKADVIHAHTPYRVGIPAQRAAHRLGIPFIYEMRGVWEETAVANGRWKSGGLAHRRFKNKETKTLASADAVICISEALKQDVISRGVKEERITVVPNGASNETMSDSNPSEEDAILLKQHCETLQTIEGISTVGYIGSIQALEGLELMVDALAHLKEKGVKTKLLVVSASEKESLIEYIEGRDLKECSLVIGPVPRHMISEYYGMIDIFCVPRPRLRVSELVTPLKPMESMMAGCATIISDLAALQELVDDGNTGRVFTTGDAQDLASVIKELSNDELQRERLGKNARKWVSENRLWPELIKKYLPVYDKVKVEL